MSHTRELSTLCVIVAALVTACSDRPKAEASASRFLKTAIDAVANMEDEGDRAYWYVDIAAVQAKIGDIKGARETAASIRHSGIRSQAFLETMRIQALGGDLAGAAKTTDSIDDTLKRASALSAIAVAKGKSGDMEGARAAFKDAMWFVRLNEQNAFAVFWYRDIAGYQAEIGDIAGAEATASSIKNAEVRCGAYQFITRALLEVHDVDRARRCAAQLPSVADTISDLDTRAWEYRTIASLQAELADIATAKATAAAIELPLAKSDAFREIALVQAKTGSFAEARQTVNLIVNSVCAIKTLSEIAVLRSRAGKTIDAKEALEHAMRLAEEIAGPEGKAEAYQAVAAAQAEMGELTGAEETMAKIIDTEAKNLALRSIAYAQAERGRVDLARATVNRMSESDRIGEVYLHVADKAIRVGKRNELLDWASSSTNAVEKAGICLGALSGLLFNDGERQWSIE